MRCVNNPASGEDLVYTFRNVCAKSSGDGKNDSGYSAIFYLQLADEIRAMASIFVRRMRGDITDIDFAEQAAKVSANLHDIPRGLFALSSQ